MNSEITTESEQHVNAPQTTSPVPITAAPILAQPYVAIKSATSNIQHPQQPAHQSPTTGQKPVLNPTQGMLAREKATIFMVKVDDGIKKINPGQRKQYELEVKAATPLIIEYERTDPDDLPRKEINIALKASMDKANFSSQANTPGSLMIAKVMCGDNEDRAKKIAHYGVVANKFGCLPTEEAVEEFYKEYGPPQTVWQDWNKNGTPKTTATSNAAVPGKNSDPKLSRKDLIRRGELAATKKTLYKAAPHSLKDKIKPPGKKMTVVILAEIDPDLGFQCNVVIDDEKLVKNAYMIYGQKYVTPAEDMANRLEQVTEKKALSIYYIREQTNDEIANECERRWEAEKDTTDVYKDVPEGLKIYDELVQAGEVVNLRSKDEGTEFYQNAVMQLEQQKQVGIDVDKHLNCPFDPNIHVDIMHMPRLSTFTSQRNQDKQNDVKQQALFVDILKEKARELRDKIQLI